MANKYGHRRHVVRRATQKTRQEAFDTRRQIRPVDPAADTGAVGGDVVRFHHPTTLSAVAAFARPRLGTHATMAYGLLGTAGTTQTTVAVLRDGVLVGSLTFAAGVTEAELDMGDVTFGEDAGFPLLSISITSPGTGAANLLVEVVVV